VRTSDASQERSISGPHIDLVKAAGFQDVEVLKESPVSIDCMTNDPAASAIMEEMNLSSDMVERIGEVFAVSSSEAENQIDRRSGPPYFFSPRRCGGRDRTGERRGGQRLSPIRGGPRQCLSHRFPGSRRSSSQVRMCRSRPDLCHFALEEFSIREGEEEFSTPADIEDFNNT